MGWWIYFEKFQTGRNLRLLSCGRERIPVLLFGQIVTNAVKFMLAG